MINLGEQDFRSELNNIISTKNIFIKLILQYLSKEFSVPAERVGDKVIFVGRRDPEDFKRLFEIYLKDYIECPTCISPDTKVEKEHRISFLICEACGAKSTIKGKYV